MKKWVLLLSLLFLCSCAKPVAVYTPSDGTTVTTKYGKVQGFTDKNAKIWLGIPYAKPPVGNLRYRRNQPPEHWNGIKKCVQFGNKPVQYMNMMNLERTKVTASEDCLYLNVWAPANAKPSAKLPVFVWVYGGAYHMGEASDPMYDGASFAADGVIFVSFNYRVGPLGFYDFSMYDKRFESNCGVSDQLAALRWVHENIAFFGGDPANVTISGESAGGTAVYSMLAAPAAKGYFQKAIAQSGVAGNIETRRTVDLNNAIFFEKLGIDPKKDIQKLVTMPAKDMLDAALFTLEEGPKRHPGIYMPGPVRDDLLPNDPWDALKTGQAKNIKVILGTNNSEGSMFSLLGLLPTNWSEVSRMLKDNNAENKLASITALYEKEEGGKKLEALAKDCAFVVNMLKVADAQSQFADTYVYRFDYVPLALELLNMGATHSTEIPTALANNEHPVWWLTPKENREAITKSMHGAWINFIKHGTPNTPGLTPEWPKFHSSDRLTYVFDGHNHVEKNPDSAAFEVWKNITLYH